MAVSTIATLDNGFLLLLVMLCLVMLSVAFLRRSRQRNATARDVTREQLARLRDQREVHHSMDDLLVQLEEVSRRINAQVETRFAKLETVIRDADDRIARLQQLAVGTVGDAHPVDATTMPTVETRGVGNAHPAPPPPPPSPIEHRRQRVYEMADAGTAPITIADALQMPLGEVELILNLRNFK